MKRKRGCKSRVLFLCMICILCFNGMGVQAASKKEKAMAAYSAALEKQFFNTKDGEEKVGAVSFALIHMNKDQIPELLVKCYLGGGWGGTKGYLVYAYKNGAVQRVGTINGGESNTEAYYYKKARILREDWVRWERDVRDFWTIKNGKLWCACGRSKLLKWGDYDKVLKTDYYADGKPVSKSKQNAAVKKLVGSEKGINVETLLMENNADNRAKLNAAQPKLRLNKSSVTLDLKKNKTVKLKASLAGNSGKVKWGSSNPQVASVDSSGKVTAKKAGKATITAKAGGKSVKCRITVKKGTDGKKEKTEKKSTKTEYRPVTGKIEKRGTYYMWIDGNRCLHIRENSGQTDLVTLTGCDGGISNGKTVYYIRKSGNGASIVQYSISAKTEKPVAFLRGVSQIVGAYKNRLILSAAYSEKDSGMDTMYSYNMNTGKMKRISYTCECTGAYKHYFIFKGMTGGINSVQMGVYNAKTNKVKTLTENSWYMVQNGKQIYYVKEVGSTPAYIIKKLKIYRYTMTTGKTKALSKTVTVSVTRGNQLTKNKFTYYDENGKKHTLRF